MIKRFATLFKPKPSFTPYYSLNLPADWQNSIAEFHAYYLDDAYCDIWPSDRVSTNILIFFPLFEDPFKTGSIPELEKLVRPKKLPLWGDKNKLVPTAVDCELKTPVPIGVFPVIVDATTGYNLPLILFRFFKYADFVCSIHVKAVTAEKVMKIATETETLAHSLPAAGPVPYTSSTDIEVPPQATADMLSLSTAICQTSECLGSSSLEAASSSVNPRSESVSTSLFSQLELEAQFKETYTRFLSELKVIFPNLVLHENMSSIGFQYNTDFMSDISSLDFFEFLLYFLPKKWDAYLKRFASSNPPSLFVPFLFRLYNRERTLLFLGASYETITAFYDRIIDRINKELPK